MSLILLASIACQREREPADHPSVGSSSPGSTDVTSGSGSPTGSIPVPGASLGVADADLTLPPEMFGELWHGFQVQKDIGEDSADDVVSKFMEIRDKFYEDSSRTAYGVWPAVLSAEPMWPITSPAKEVDPAEGNANMGVSLVWPTVDVTGDGSADLWVRDQLSVTMLVPGPRDTAVLDPAVLAVASFEGWGVPQSTDLDRDGVGELLVGLSVDGSAYPRALARCEGPFVGKLDFSACPTAVHADASSFTALLSGDIDGDGIDEVVIDAQVASSTPDPGWSDEVVLLVYDGAFIDGEADPLLTVHPQSRYFYYADETRAALDDLDGDGLGDSLWTEQPDFYASDEGEIVVLHAPPTNGENLGTDDATLHLVGLAADAEIAGTARKPDDSAWLVLHPPASRPVAEAYPPMLVDGTLRGTVDPADKAWFLATDGVGAFEDSVWVESDVGDFDGDALGDVLVVDRLNRAGWVYLGASLP